MDKNSDLEKIEIRSDKVRKIISERPPFFIRNGTMILAVLLLIIALIIYGMYCNDLLASRN